MNDISTIHEKIDLIGLNSEQAYNVTEKRLKETRQALLNNEIKPNYLGNDHIFKVIAHAGKTSAGG
jgi:hypothetical protein